MINLNKIIICGRLTSKPELRYTQSSKPHTRFCVAVNGYQDKTDFINCECWDKLAENLCKYQDKGNKILLEGRLHSSSYEVNGEKRTSVSVVCTSIEYMPMKNAQNDENIVQNNDLHKQEDTEIDDPFADFGDQISIDDNFLD